MFSHKQDSRLSDNKLVLIFNRAWAQFAVLFLSVEVIEQKVASSVKQKTASTVKDKERQGAQSIKE